jgi:hypothetical protein
LLLQYGALVGGWRRLNDTNIRNDGITALNRLLGDNDKSRRTKLVICRMLVAVVVEQQQRANPYLKQSLRYEVNRRNFMNVTILVEAGMEPTLLAWNVAIRANQLALCQLMLLAAAANGDVGFGGVDLFQQQQQVQGDEDHIGNDDDDDYGVSPFHTAARQADTSILTLLLSFWQVRFAASGGNKNEYGEYPIHAICRDQHVSLEAVQLLLAMQAPLALAKHNGYFSFEIAAMSNASIDVIYTMFQHCTDAVLREQHYMQ